MTLEERFEQLMTNISHSKKLRRPFPDVLTFTRFYSSTR